MPKKPKCPECHIEVSTAQALENHLNRGQLKHKMFCYSCETDTQSDCHDCTTDPPTDPNKEPVDLYEYNAPYIDDNLQEFLEDIILENLSHPLTMVPKAFALIYFNEIYPENHIIYVVDKKNILFCHYKDSVKQYNRYSYAKGLKMIKECVISSLANCQNFKFIEESKELYKKFEDTNYNEQLEHIINTKVNKLIVEKTIDRVNKYGIYVPPN